MGIQEHRKRPYRTLTAFGKDQSQFYWVYKGNKDEPVPSGDEKLYAILDLPDGISKVTGTMTGSCKYSTTKLFFFTSERECEMIKKNFSLPIEEVRR